MESVEILDEIVNDLYPSDDEQLAIVSELSKTEAEDAAKLEQKHALFGELVDRVGSGILPLIANVAGFIIASKCLLL